MINMETDWTLDYCLACDRQTAGQAYCSQICRLADLDSSLAGSEPSSPSSAGSFSGLTSTSRSPTNGFFLPPAFNFSAYRTAPAASTSPSRPVPVARPLSTSYTTPTSNTNTPSYMIALNQSSTRSLTPSSSRSSLISVQGDSLSTQVRSELRDYTNSFDQVRDTRRRRTLN